MTYKRADLRMAQGKDNKNKYYLMEQVNDREFEVKSGRVGVKPRKYTFDISRWDEKYREKTKPYNPKTKKGGYVDRTDLAVEVVQGGSKVVDISDPQIASLMRRLQGYSDKSLYDNYTVEAGQVTQAMLDHARVILNEIDTMSANADVDKINMQLERLYTTIPRKMKNVQLDGLIQTDWPSHRVEQKAQYFVYLEEQNIDVMAQQVKSVQRASTTSGIDILEAMGLVVTEADFEQTKAIREMVEIGDRHHVSKVYVVGHKASDLAMLNHKMNVGNQTEKLFFHGSRNENWMSILDNGLIVRPVGVRATGYDMYGKGIYFAPKFLKSFGYTSAEGAYWSSEGSNKGYMALFKVHTGKEWRIQGHQNWHYKINADRLRREGNYDSVFAPKGRNLLNDEYVVYNNNQVTMAYLIEVT